jgi:hypothetical protein
MRKKWFFIVPAAIVGITLFCFIGGEVVMYLWNWLLPPMFGWRQLDFWHALGLLALCRILFGRSGWHRAGHSRFRSHMKERMEGRCANMTPEERERFRHGMRGHWDPPEAPAAETKA